MEDTAVETSPQTSTVLDETNDEGFIAVDNEPNEREVDTPIEKSQPDDLSSEVPPFVLDDPDVVLQQDEDKITESKSVVSGESNLESVDSLPDLDGDVTLAAVKSVATPPATPPPPTTAVAGPAETKSVTSIRKEELLLEARRDRLQWIQKAPLPYQKYDPPTDKLTEFITKSHVSRSLPAACDILRYLADSSDIEQIICEDETIDQGVYLTGNQILSAEIESTTDHEQKKELELYQTFLVSLQDPACSALVQGMRSIIRNFSDTVNIAEASTKLKSYFSLSIELFKEQDIFAKFDETDLKRCIESFFFAHCHTHLLSLFQNPEMSLKEGQFGEKLQMLDFVTPLHLEIKCLLDAGPESLKEFLSDASQALNSIDLYFSMFEKLQQVLSIYRGVNAALTKALSEEGKLPSADDILPTIILTVLSAKPENLLLNLQMMEELSPPEYLRGEAGYAFTNLYGAVQFLIDLNLDDEPSSLQISESAFRERMVAQRAKIDQETARLSRAKAENPTLTTEVDTSCVNVPPPQVLREARLRGESVDLAWALNWQLMNGGAVHNSTVYQDREVGKDSSEPELPVGFRRNYSYLMTQPEDVRMSDLPILLEEYRMLVRATECLLGERTAKASADRKRQSRAMENELLANARSVDPSFSSI